MIGTDNSHLRSVGSNDKRVARDNHGRSSAHVIQVNLRIHARKQRIVLVWHVDFDQQRAAGGVQRAGATRHRSLELPPGQIRDLQHRRLAHPDGTGMCLRNVHISAQRAGLRDPEEKRAARGSRAPRHPHCAT